jgi:DNA-binding response OmpR family regulator
MSVLENLGPSLNMGELYPVGEVRVLIIDDDPSVCALVKAALARPEFRIDVISEPAEIEDKLREASEAGRGSLYHLIVLDYILPGTESEQVFHWLSSYLPEASVVVITGHPSVDSVITCLRARTFDYLTKPVQVQELRSTVSRCLASKGLLRLSEDALRIAVGTVIRERRKALDLTLAKMADRTQVSLGYLSQIELGKNSASIETLYKICLALGIPMADLFKSLQRESN